MIDTAAAYFNEREVGEGIRRSGISRGELFVQTKLWISDYGYERALRAFDASLQRLGLDYVDMTGCPEAQDKYARALDKLRAALEDALAGKVRYRAWYADLKPLDFRAVIRDKTRGFYRRRERGSE